MAFIFVTQKFTNEPFTTYIAVPEEDVRTQPLANCCDQYGQRIGSEEAGDCLTLKTEKAIKTANALVAGWEQEETIAEFYEIYDVEETYNLQPYNVVEAYKDSSIFNACIELLEEGEDYELHQEEVRSVDFHDGHNWRTYLLEGEGQDLEEVDEELAAELAAAIEGKEYETEQPGITVYRSGKWRISRSAWQDEKLTAFAIQIEGKWRISRSAWQGSFGAYEIILEEEYESIFA